MGLSEDANPDLSIWGCGGSSLTVQTAAGLLAVFLFLEQCCLDFCSDFSHS